MASTAAGACEAAVFNPVQIAKARLQIAITNRQPGTPSMTPKGAVPRPPTLLQELRHVHAQRQWFLGLRPSLYVLATRRGITFAAQGIIEDGILAAQRAHALGGYQLPAGAVAALSGAVAGVLEAPLTNPFRLVALLAQSGQHAGNVGSLRDSFRYVYDQDGPRGFMRGLGMTLVRNWVSAGVYFGTLHYLEHGVPQTKRAGLRRLRDATLSGAAMTAAVLASNGINVILTRMQNQLGSPLGARQTARDLLRQEGWRGYWKGGAASVVRTVPGAAFSYALMKVFLEICGPTGARPVET